eukprot:CAMPEP_0194247118 /NCGR_PEP_ID=MMETSP0158-20130606/16063_1 /TAXON_ID=33649 /ORGANISM="Thalassionema nitzschioides, Strain L26-B" /LENGTH=322 /DNA_ID=CAMNT_0038983167 /DNA_START=9 /DNA_END=977 /DNA_ORIENTATION=+
MLCGQHALNNLVQASVFSAGSLSEIAHQLDEMELAYMAANNEGGVRSKDYLRRLGEGSGNVDEQGNFSIQVLGAALQQSYGLSLPSIGQDDLDKSRDITSYPGFICNRASHWFAIRKIGEQFWNLNSTLDKPQFISHFRLAAELESFKENGYSVFVVPVDELPKADRSTGTSQFWWHRKDLESGGKENAPKTDWNDVGMGRRLDGKKIAEASKHEDHSSLTEEEMLQKALQASILPDIPDEPPVDATGVVTIQFRFSNGKKQRRRFLADQPVQVVYAFCEREMGGGNVELRYGFPPRDLAPNQGKSIAEANLSGENIQVRSI